MSPKEKKVYYETKLRNLKRVKSRLLQHADLIEETQFISNEINHLEEILDQEF